ncbi:hypothetical protein [Oceanivirga miroungae]|uniref:Uncharacterized protein n=1 Tax=Oceanivirga miroungae TaxID=1130046 RepID=A0A6I8M7W2_9FUSO|nr:hypothetical protein [Oceanivirga miroungae]VWL89635.1 hypothetical protein OMES3154_01283 [Oceanivirga miroungae]
MYKGYKIYEVKDEKGNIKYATDDFKLFEDISELERHIDFLLGKEYNIEEYYNILHKVEDYELFDFKLNNEYIKNKILKENIDVIRNIFIKNNLSEISLKLTNYLYCDNTTINDKKIEYYSVKYNDNIYYLLVNEEGDILGYEFDNYFGIRKELNEFISLRINDK